MAALFVEVGAGRLSLEGALAAVAARDRAAMPFFTAPPSGLVLMNVLYPPDSGLNAESGPEPQRHP